MCGIMSYRVWHLSVRWVFLNTYILFVTTHQLNKIMEKVEDSSNGEVKKRIIKGQRGISLRACVAKAAGWTLEKANATKSQETTSNKQSDSKWHEHLLQVIRSFPCYIDYMWFSRPSPILGRLRVVGLASHKWFYDFRQWTPQAVSS